MELATMDFSQIILAAFIIFIIIFAFREIPLLRRVKSEFAVESSDCTTNIINAIRRVVLEKGKYSQFKKEVTCAKISPGLYGLLMQAERKGELNADNVNRILASTAGK